MNESNRWSRFLTLVFLLLLLVTSIITPTLASETSTCPVYSSTVRDYWPTDGWMNSTPEEQGMSSTRLQQMIDHIADEDLDGVVRPRQVSNQFPELILPTKQACVVDVEARVLVEKSALAGNAHQVGRFQERNDGVVRLASAPLPTDY